MAVLVYPPGYFLLEEMIERDWSVSKLSNLLQIDEDTIRRLICGEIAIGEDMSRRLATIMPGLSSGFWLRLQQRYDAKREKD